MTNLNKFCIIFVILLLYFGKTKGETYICKISGTNCTIEGLNSNKNDFEIEPVTNNRLQVKTVNLHGTLKSLTAKKICKALPNLEEFYAERISLEEVKNNAFEDCKKLKILNLDFNNIKRIDKYAFRGLSNLWKLTVGGGSLPNPDLDLTDMKELSWFSFFGLNIVNFPADMLREQKKLDNLWLYSNNLFDLNIEEIIKNNPNLKYIILSDNNFKCKRLAEIHGIIKKSGTKEVHKYVNELKRKRSYATNTVHGTECLKAEIWESEFAKVHIESTTTTPSPINPTTIPYEENINVTAILTEQEQRQDKKMSELETKLIDRVENLHSATTKQIGTIGSSLETLTNMMIEEKSNKNKLENTLNNVLLTLDSKINNQDTQITNLQENIEKNYETLKADALKQDEKISNLNQNLDKGLKTIDKKIGDQEKKISNLEDNLTTGLKKIEKKETIETVMKDNKVQEKEIAELKERLKLLDSKVANKISEFDKKYVTKEAYDELKQQFKRVVAKFKEDLEDAKSDNREACIKFLDEKCSEEACSTY